jgi:moderate conductance mechanosensitive channel
MEYLAETLIRDSVSELESFFAEPNAMRSIIILFLSVIFAYWLSSFLAKGIIKMAQFVAIRADNAPTESKQLKLLRIETYLSIATAVVRLLSVVVVAFFAWQFLSPAATPSVAAIGAGALFIVMAGGTIGVMLRDLTSGTAMITEGWYHVGDYVKFEPFIDVSGVVERATLRSPKIRSLNGEVIWLHNQYIQGVHVTPRGVRTTAIDIFVNNEEKGKELVKKVINTIPLGTLLITKKPTIKSIDRWGDDLWRIVVYGYTAPGREWLMDRIFVELINSMDEKMSQDNIIVYPPITRFADAEAEKNFKRAIKLK